MRKLTVVLLFIALLVAAGAGWWYHYTGQPQYSLYKLASAVKANDYETARYFVDEERLSEDISKSVTDAVVGQYMKEASADSNPFSGLGVAMMQMMAPRLREMAKEQVKDGIKQALSGNDTLTSKTGTNKADLHSFSSLTIEQVAVSGNTAEVLLGGIPQPNPFELKDLRVRMARISESRSWRIVEAPDVGKVFSRLLEEKPKSASSSK